MNFAELKTATQATRFNPAQITNGQIGQWLQDEYAALWREEDWLFRRIALANLAITAGQASPTLPADFEPREPLELFNDQHNELERLTSREFNRYVQILGDLPSGQPEVYTLAGAVLTLAPTPSANATFQLSYQRALSVYTSSARTTTAVRNLTQDADEPLFDPNYHDVLVYGATVRGLVLENDPTYGSIDAMKQAALEGLRSAQAVELPQGSQFGSERDLLGAL